MENDSDTKDNEKITLKIQDQDGSVLEFKVKKNITFKKILKTYADYSNKDSSKLRLLFKGKVLGMDETPDYRNIEDMEMLEVTSPQEGGQ